jgi:enoyl-CoA hydratase/carnithine racemase
MTSRFGMLLAQTGMSTSWFLTEKIMEVAGPVATRRILLLGRPLSAIEMHRLGIISYLAESAALEDAARGVIDQLATNAPLSLRTMKALIVRRWLSARVSRTLILTRWSSGFGRVLMR